MNFFIAICLILGIVGHSTYISFLSDKKPTLAETKKEVEIQSIERFQGIDFYQTKKNEPEFNLKSSVINHKDLKKGELLNPELVFFKDGKEVKLRAKSGNFEFDKNKTVDLKDDVEMYSDDYRLKSDSGSYDANTQSVLVKGDVRSNYKDYFLDCDEGTYNLGTKKFTGKGNVRSRGKHQLSGDKINISSDFVEAYPEQKKTLVKGNVKGEILRKRRYEGKVKFKAEEITANLKEEKLEMNGKVQIKRNNVTVNANQSKIFVQNFNKRLKYYELNGNVVINQKLLDPKTMSKYQRTAYAEKLEGFAREKKIILTGSPRVESKNNLIKGSKILIKENANLVEVLDTSAKIDTKDGL